MPFDMPPASAGFAKRGRWLIDHLSVDLGISENQAAGIVGNVGFESAGLTTLQERDPIAGRGGYGWAQWTGTRRQAYESWCAKRAIDPASDEANYGFMLVELEGDYDYLIRDLKQKATLEDCVFLVGRLYETPYGTTETHLPGYSGRLTYAQRALAGDDSVHVPSPTTTAAIPAESALQAALVAVGAQIVIDGWWGPRSGAALQAYYDAKRGHAP